jgi:spore coat protein U-like protein
MNTKRNVLKAIAVATLTLTTGLTAADGTQELNVTAEVRGVCKFITGSAISVNFGIIDPSGSLPATTAISVPYKCTKNTPAPTVDIAAGGAALTGPGGTTMGYAIALPFATVSGAGFGPAVADSNAITTASIAPAQYQNAVAGVYTDTVTLSINP